MAEEKFKLPDSSYDELVKIIRAYGRTNKAVPLKEVTRISGVPLTVVSGNNGFLLSIGVIEGGKAKAPTQLGAKLAMALEHEMPEEIERAWRDVVRSSDFLAKMLAAIKIRKGMDAATLQGHIAYSAGEPRTQRTMTGANAVIDVLRAAGLVKEEDGRITATELPEQPPTDAEEWPSEPGLRSSGIALPPTVLQPPGGSVSVHIEIRVEVKPGELEGLGAKLRKVVEEFSGRASDQSAGTAQS